MKQRLLDEPVPEEKVTEAEEPALRAVQDEMNETRDMLEWAKLEIKPVGPLEYAIEMKNLWIRVKHGSDGLFEVWSKLMDQYRSGIDRSQHGQSTQEE